MTQPNLLLATTCRWFSTARLGVELTNAGCSVEAVCPSGHPLEKTDAVRGIHIYHALAPLRSFEKAIHAAKPQLIVPGDDLATEHLHDLYERTLVTGEPEIRALIERSLGAATSYRLVELRGRLMALAREEGVRVPETRAFLSADELQDWIAGRRFPVVLKADGTWGGMGVRIVDSPEEALRAYEELQVPPLTGQVMKRAVMDRDLTLVTPWVHRKTHIVTGQNFIAGPDATATVACWQGKVLAEVSLKVLKKCGLTGPSMAVRLITNREISEACKKIVGRLGLSGLNGFDFIMEERTGAAYLIEMNPRATPTSHLPFGEGRDLLSALAAVVSERPPVCKPAIPKGKTIALFPYALEQKPGNDSLAPTYCDVPWNEPKLVVACAQSLADGGWLSRKTWMNTPLGKRLRRIVLGESHPARAITRPWLRKQEEMQHASVKSVKESDAA